MRVLDLQRRSHQTGRIRLGQAVKTGKQDKNGKDITRPVKLDYPRFTSPSRHAIAAVAEAFGGEVRPWENRGRSEWEVLTKVPEFLVAVPPSQDAISISYEMWTGGGCTRRCDSQHEQKSNGPCLCPHAENPDDLEEVEEKAKLRALLAKKNPPQACSLKTRVNLVLPDLPDVGVWRLDTGSFYAAGEMLGKAELMELCRDRNVFLPARFWIDHRVEVTDGQTRKYPVPVLELLATFRQVATGELESGGWAAQLPPPPGQPLAITQGAPAAKPAPPAAPAPPARPVAPTAPAAAAGTVTAQQIANRAAQAQTRADVEALAAEAESAGVHEDHVITDDEGDVWEELHNVLTARWKELPAAQAQPQDSLFGDEPGTAA